jgi:hypothetical protein
VPRQTRALIGEVWVVIKLFNHPIYKIINDGVCLQAAAPASSVCGTDVVYTFEGLNALPSCGRDVVLLCMCVSSRRISVDNLKQLILLLPRHSSQMFLNSVP